MAGPYATLYGDSIGDHETPAYGGGIWFDQVCSFFGWTRRGGGASSSDNTRAAIIGTAIQPVGVPTHGYNGVPTRLAPYMVAGSDNYLGIELATNDYFASDNTWTPTSLGAYIDLMMADIAAMAVQPRLTFWIGMTPQAQYGINPVAATPFTWAATPALAWAAIDNVVRAKCARYGVVYIDMHDMPDGLMPDHTHPTTPLANAFYSGRAIATLQNQIAPPFREDPVWHCARKYPAA